MHFSIETTEYKSDDLLNNEISNIDLNNVKPYVKIHPQRRRMDVNDENLPIRVWFILILNKYILLYFSTKYLYVRPILWDQIQKVMH
jgi:hypothetical protein